MGKQDGGPALAPAWERPSQHAGEQDLITRYTFSDPIGQQLSQTSDGPANPLREPARGWNARQSLAAHVAQASSSDAEGNTMQWSNFWPQALTWKQPALGRAQSPMAFLPSPPQGKDITGTLGGPGYSSSSEASTQSLPIAPITPKSLPGAALTPKRLHGRKGPLVALSLLGMLVFLGGLGLAVLHLRKPPALPLQVIAAIPLSHGPNRFDYQSLDPRSRLLFIAHSGASIVTIFDTVSMRVVADVSGITDVHGVVAAPDQGLVYAEATGANEVEVIAEHTHVIVARIPVGDGPDGMAYDPTDHKLFVSDETGQNDVVIDTRTEQRITEIPLGVRLARRPMMPLRAASWLRRRHSINSSDSGWHYLYVASESGVVTVFDEQGRVVRKLGQGYVAVGAHTVAVDPSTHYLYVPLQNVGGSSILEIALFHP